MMEFDREYTLNLLKEIMSVDSPSGYCKNVMKVIEREAVGLGYKFYTNPKGNGIFEVPGKDHSKTMGVCAHVDTLGCMVRSIKSNGNLAFTRIGGPIPATLDSELCRVRTRDGRVYTGTFHSNSPAAHVYEDAKTLPRNEDTMEVILDEIVHCKEDVEKLGIMNGDYICIDPKTIITENGFIKSRFLDDKMSVAIIFGALKYMHEHDLIPNYDLKVMMSTYEEVGHGMAHIPSDIDELLAIDMGCIGKDLSCSEYTVSICAKDSAGPYDYDMTTKLINLAKEANLNFAVDIYPFYSSDASAALRGGQNIKAALIGSGIFASHGYERTHYQGVENSMNLLVLYLTK